MNRKLGLALREELFDIFQRLAWAAEGALSSRFPEKAICREDLNLAMETFASPNWLPEPSTVDGERLWREWEECRQLGIFPVEILQELSEDTSWLEDEPTPNGILEQVMQELLDFLNDLNK